jgi:hypothetical protein
LKALNIYLIKPRRQDIMDEEKKTEEFKVNGEELMAKIKAIIREGNARKITIKDKDDKEILSFPLTVGVVGIALAPIFAAVATITALATECTIVIER